ncbi:hypothetical protein ACWCXE_27075 [Streptomyces sp. NPDC001780]
MTQQTDAPQGSHHFVLTIQKPIGPGAYAIADFSGWINLASGSTRHDAFKAIREEHARRNPETRDGTVLFFYLERNQL